MVHHVGRLNIPVHRTGRPYHGRATIRRPARQLPPPANPHDPILADARRDQLDIRTRWVYTGRRTLWKEERDDWGGPVICKCDGNCHRIFQWSENPVHAETRWVQRSRTFLHSSQKLLANNIILITMVRTWRPAWYRRLGRSESHVPTSGIIPPHSLVTGLICRAGSLQEDPHRCHCRCRPHRDAGRLPRGLLRRIRLL